MRLAVPHPRYRVYRETRTKKDSEIKCDIWTTNSHEYGIELKVNLVTEADIKKYAKQAIKYARNRDKQKQKAVHVLYHRENKYAAVHRLNYEVCRVLFAAEE